MTDFKELREALEATPLPHKWKVYEEAPNSQWFAGTTIGAADPVDARRVADTCRLSLNAKAFARYIAAANPATISALLAELDAARRDAEMWRSLSLKPNEVLVALARVEGYEDVHPELVSEDAIGDRWPEYRTIDAMKEQQQ